MATATQVLALVVGLAVGVGAAMAAGWWCLAVFAGWVAVLEAGGRVGEGRG